MPAEVPHTALLAQGLARVADRAAVQNQAVAEIVGALRREQLSQLHLDLHRILEVIHKAEEI